MPLFKKIKEHDQDAVEDFETRKKYRQIGYDSCMNGLDRRIADDFNTQYRPYIRQGWDEANASKLFASLNIGGPDKSELKRKLTQ